ncbi:MAG TPA: malto-oligosyltrehalose synthase, partial [Burkholderiaceae bacterium]|nr:malto-oligosyltrehalose synthase [Burkholderiaceae bacterium]
PAAGSLALHYHAHRFPLAPRSYAAILEPAALLAENAALADLARAFGHVDAGDVVHTLLLKQWLAALVGAHRAIQAAVDALNAPDQRDALHALHEMQVYRLAHWRLAADDVNYRRFFDINDLAALRMELPEVFEATHGLLLDLAAAGQVNGLRIDHPDGLKDPAQYFERLQQGYARRAGLAAGAAGGRPLYVVAEKIAAPHEDVPTGWALHGTTGYRFAMVANGVLVDGDAAEAFDRVWQWFVADDTPFGEHVAQARREAACRTLASELDRLAMMLLLIARSDRHTRDHSLNSLHEALAGITACMPVYRTYVIDTPSAQDLHLIDWAVAQARRRSRLADLSVFDFVRACLCNQPSTPAAAERVRDFAQRFQQFSAPVAAKGVEDTAFYRYHRLVSLNEVGGDPAVFGISPRAFHAASADRAARWPHTLIATSTHDNKRSEDVRNRINVLSEMPRAWDEWLGRWHAMSTSLRTDGAGTPMPSPADEYLLYQTLLGTLPAAGLDEAGLGPYRERIRNYMIKAAREAKQRTGWTRPDEAYEQALCSFVEGLLVRVRPNPLLSDLSHCARVVAGFGALNSLSTVLLKYTAPGVPDLYQGNELMDLSLVDPDNRRPVDHGLRERLLHELDDMEGAAGARLPERLAALVREPHDGRAKLWLTSRLLRLRAAHEEFFHTAGYVALEVSGARARHVLAYVRAAGEVTMVVIVGRLFTGLVSDPLAGQAPWPVGAEVWG